MCFEQCICTAISYNKTGCFLFDKDYQAIEDSEYISIFKRNICKKPSEIVVATKMIKKALMNPYKSIWDDIKSNECWSYCQKESRCYGSMLKDYLCHLFDQNISMHNDAKSVSYLKLNIDHADDNDDHDYDHNEDYQDHDHNHAEM